MNSIEKRLELKRYNRAIIARRNALCDKFVLWTIVIGALAIGIKIYSKIG